MNQGPSSQSEERPRGIREDAINLPNLLTMGRVVLIPVVLWLMGRGGAVMSFWAAMVYIACAVTDALDGWLARRQNLISVLGKFLDPLADKLLVLSTLVFMVELERVPAWAAIIVIIREVSITALRSIASAEGVVIAAGQGGKEKTALQMVAILLLILHYPYQLDFFFVEVQANLHSMGLLLLFGSIVLAITSAGEYVRLFVEAVEAKEARLAEASRRQGQRRSEESVP